MKCNDPVGNPAVEQLPHVVIIGAGISGLSTAKYCSEANLRPLVLEKSDNIGGLWQPGGAPWESLRTNLSKYTCCFSDHDWPQDAPLFPRAAELFGYIER